MKLNAYLEKPGSCTAADLAKKIGVSPVLVSQWRTESRPVPVERCPAIDRATGGEVRCEDLRPDVEKMSTTELREYIKYRVPPTLDGSTA